MTSSQPRRPVELADGNPLSFLHVSRPELDLPPETNAYADIVYETAQRNFRRLIDAAPLVYEDRPSIYLYRQQMGSHVQTGVAACCSVDEYDRDVIRKHEKTRKDKEDDRTRHIVDLRAQTGPVFLTYQAVPAINAVAARRRLARRCSTSRPPMACGTRVARPSARWR